MTKEEVRQEAIEWQRNMSEHSFYHGEIFEQQERFRKLAEEFDLVEEFEENGII